MKDLYNENFKTLNKLKKILKDEKTDYLCSWIGKITTVKMTVLLKAMDRFNELLSKSPDAFFTEIEKLILYCI
jgi:DNA polymerase III delta subunit